jgi:hypothetical protein
MKQKKAATPTPPRPAAEQPDEEGREGPAVERGGLVELARHPAHEAFEYPHREGDVEHAVRQRHRPGRVEQPDRAVELEEGQREHRRRRHAVRQQPEEQVLVAEEAVVG